MALTPNEVKAGTPQDVEKTDAMEVHVDDYMRTNYDGQELKITLPEIVNSKVQSGLVTRYTASGWNASFEPRADVNAANVLVISEKKKGRKPVQMVINDDGSTSFPEGYVKPGPKPGTPRKKKTDEVGVAA